jgi:hypothetical protein
MPMVLVLVAAVLAVVLAVALFLSVRADRRPSSAASSSPKLPVGAEAAIWSILEAVPDPRNHLALTRDLTGEVRITGTPLDPAFRAAAAARVDAAALWGTEPPAAVQLDPETLDLRTLEPAS